jgi:hypothetical protein
MQIKMPLEGLDSTQVPLSSYIIDAPSGFLELMKTINTLFDKLLRDSLLPTMLRHDLQKLNFPPAFLSKGKFIFD